MCQLRFNSGNIRQNQLPEMIFNYFKLSYSCPIEVHLQNANKISGTGAFQIKLQYKFISNCGSSLKAAVRRVGTGGLEECQPGEHDLWFGFY